MSYGSLPVSPMIPVRPSRSRYPVRKLPHQRSEPVDFSKDTGYGKPLLLPSGELDSTLSDICIISIGKCHDKFVGIGIFAAAITSSLVASGFPYRIFSKIVPANRYTSCCTIPMWSRRLFNVTLRTSFPSTRIHPRLHHRIAESGNKALSFRHRMIPPVPYMPLQAHAD